MSLMLWTINPLNHHEKMYHRPCCATRGRKMKRHWHSCWWTKQEGMLLNFSLSSLWVIREAACWRQLLCDLDILVSPSCWHNTLTKKATYLKQPQLLVGCKLHQSTFDNDDKMAPFFTLKSACFSYRKSTPTFRNVILNKNKRKLFNLRWLW